MRRFYQKVIDKHVKEDRQMIFLMGPRQVGKTTISQLIGEDRKNGYYYLNWDNHDHRLIIIGGPGSVAEFAQLDKFSEKKPIIVFDEIHKYYQWKDFLKGFFDTYGNIVQIIVTGSARLDVFHKSGDSLMGRYFPYRIHPLSIAEIIGHNLRDVEISSPKKIEDTLFNKLWNFGGFPEPYLKANTKFYNRWKTLRNKQLLREDIKDLTNIQDINKIELLLEFIQIQATQMISYNSLSKLIRASDKSIRNWLVLLENLFYCYALRPWSKNIPRSLIKEPKYYLWDWSLCKADGARAENFVASHLLKSIHFWTDYGLGNYRLWYLRDKDKREVDFIVTKNDEPWMLVEVKMKNNKSLSPTLKYFYELLEPKYAFQVVVDMEYVNKNCFKENRPLIVPAKTFLSQLI